MYNNDYYVKHTMKLVQCAENVVYYASIMPDAFTCYYAQSYAGLIGTSLNTG